MVVKGESYKAGGVTAAKAAKADVTCRATIPPMALLKATPKPVPTKLRRMYKPRQRKVRRPGTCARRKVVDNAKPSAMMWDAIAIKVAKTMWASDSMPIAEA